MPTYSFKSSGKTQEQELAEKLAAITLPIGIKTPVRLGSDGIFEMNTNLADQIHDNLRNLILTNWGERLGIFNLGADLKPLTTEYTNQDSFDAEAIKRIRTATQRWMPYIELQDYISQFDQNENKNTAIIELTITYGIPSLAVNKRALQVNLYVI